MLDGIIEFWRSLPVFIKFPLDFFLTVIVMRGIVANEISNWLKEKGIMKDGVIHPMIKMIKRLVPHHERHLAIWNHHKFGHSVDSVLDCSQDRCVIL